MVLASIYDWMVGEGSILQVLRYTYLHMLDLRDPELLGEDGGV